MNNPLKFLIKPISLPTLIVGGLIAFSIGSKLSIVSVPSQGEYEGHTLVLLSPIGKDELNFFDSVERFCPVSKNLADQICRSVTLLGMKLHYTQVAQLPYSETLNYLGSTQEK